MEMFEKMPVFTCNGENLSLDEIQKRVINSVTISYLSEAKKVKAPGIIGLMEKKKVVK